VPQNNSKKVKKRKEHILCERTGRITQIPVNVVEARASEVFEEFRGTSSGTCSSTDVD
jgi:hypothetical protein